MTADYINAAFEMGGGLSVWGHVIVLQKDKQVKGVSLISTLFFVVWGVWNLIYYPHLNQMASFYAGVNVAVANLTYLILILRYRKHDRH